MPKHNAYLWEAHCVNPDRVIRQECEGWKALKEAKQDCIALVFKPQEPGLKQVYFDLRPDKGFVLEWVGWENTVSFNLAEVTAHVRVNKIVVRLFDGFTDTDGSRPHRDLFYYILPGGDIIMGNADYDAMDMKMRGFAHASSDSKLRSGVA